MVKKRQRGCKAACAALAFVLTASCAAPCMAESADTALRETETEYHEISYEEELAEAADVLDLGDLSDVTRDLVLPVSYGLHVSITWASSDETLVETDGTVHTPTDADKSVTLTATLTSSMCDGEETATFTVQLPQTSAADIVAEDAKTAQEYVNYILNTGYVLPDAETLGIRSDISWEVMEGAAEITDGALVKADDADERELIVLAATLSYDGEETTVTLENLTLIDEYAGYVMAYFEAETGKKEMYFGYSYDGIHWARLNGGESMVQSKKSKKTIRDPYLLRKKDGSFAVIATDGWNSDKISIWDSDDLTSFDNERQAVVSVKGVENLSGLYAWAPEATYDPITDLYYVYWTDSEPTDGKAKIYYNTTPDLETDTFSMPAVFFEREYSILDASVKKCNGDYYMVYADYTGENETGDGGRVIYMAKADSLEAGTFTTYCGVLSEPLAEGGFLLENFTTHEWMLYYDYYTQHRYGLTMTADLDTDEWEYEGISTTMPTTEVRHGSAIAVTQKELDRILETWGLDEPEVDSVARADTLRVKTGTSASSLSLPETVQVTLSDGMQTDVPVEWSLDDVSLSEAGAVVVTGTLTEGDVAYQNTEKQTAEVIVAVLPDYTWLWIVLGAVIAALAAACVVLLVCRKKV